MSEEYKRGYKQAVEDVVDNLSRVIHFCDCSDCPAEIECVDTADGKNCYQTIKDYLLKELEG